MKKLFLLLSFCFLYFASTCQTESKSSDFNFGFEKVSSNKELPDGWFKWEQNDNYVYKIDSAEKHRGHFSVLIESITKNHGKSFGCTAYKIPAIYDGKQIEVKTYMKLQDVSDGMIGLLLRIDGEGTEGVLQFDNMEKMKIEGTKDWTCYSVKLPLPKNAKTIYIGALLDGTGKLWIDDFSILIDGRDITEAKIKKPEESIMDRDTAFSKSSGIVINNLSDAKISDLMILGKVWGFLKYYHPAITKGKYNWDNELFRILPKIVGCKNASERNIVLSSWIDTLGPFPINKPEKIKSSRIKLNPDLDWINDYQELGEKLARQLGQIKNAKREDRSFYIGLEEDVGNPKFKHEKTYSQITHPDAGFYLLSLYRYWNMIQYFYPDKKGMDESWNNILKEFIPKFINAKDETAYQLVVLSLIAKVQDTHANIWGGNAALQKYQGANYAPLEITFVENKAVVKDYYAVEGTNDSVVAEQIKIMGLLKGDVILKVNNKDVEDIVKEKLPYTPASNYPTQLRDIARDLVRTNDTSLNITFKHDDITKSVTVECYPAYKLNIYKNFFRSDTCFKHLEPDIAYIYPGNIKNEYLPKVMPEFLKAKGIVIDMRCYPSDFIVFSLSQYLLPQSTSFVKFSYGSIKTPGLFVLSDNLNVGKKNSNFYKGKIVILVNEETQSQAEYTTMALRIAPSAIVIGSTTAGADGNVSEIYLPDGIKTMISGLGIYYPNGKETQRVGIVPDIEVKPTIKGIKEGKDELLEMAVEIINAK